MDNQNLKLDLTIEEANLVLEALGSMPFKQVFALVQKLQQQASQQLSPGSREEDPAPANAPAHAELRDADVELRDAA